MAHVNSKKLELAWQSLDITQTKERQRGWYDIAWRWSSFLIHRGIEGSNRWLTRGHAFTEEIAGGRAGCVEKLVSDHAPLLPSAHFVRLLLGLRLSCEVLTVRKRLIGTRKIIRRQ